MLDERLQLWVCRQDGQEALWRLGRLERARDEADVVQVLAVDGTTEVIAVEILLAVGVIAIVLNPFF